MNGPIGWLKGKLARLFVKASARLLARELYRTILKREADEAGLAHSVKMIREARSIGPLVESFITSTEFRAQYFDTRAPELVEAAYKGLFGREPDPEGFEHSVIALRSHHDLATLLAETFVDSDEFRSRTWHWLAPEVVTGAYRGLFKREPEPLGLEQGITVFRSNHDLAVFLSFMLRSTEFKLRALTMSAPRLIEATYEGLLNRPSDAKGYNNVLALFRSNLDWANVLRLTIQSGEFRTKFTAAMELKDRGVSSAPGIVRPTKGRLIIVSANCATGGVAAALQECLPDDTVLPIPLPIGTIPAKTAMFIEKVMHADVWISAKPKPYWETIQDQPSEREIQLVPLPLINFPAFHPDLSYVWKNPHGQVTALRYSSAICAWAYNKNLDPKDAKKLFNRRTYAALGYLDLWNPSIAALREAFAKCDLDFGRFILALKRRGVFMYSLDHPKVSVLIELAKQVALKLGAPESVLEKHIDVSDALTSDIWPLYPEIAEEYAQPGGSYDWKIWGKWYQGIDSFIEFSYDEYSNERLAAGTLILVNRNHALYDRVLGPQAGLV